MVVVYILIGLLALVVGAFVVYSIRGRNEVTTVIGNSPDAANPTTLLRDMVADTPPPEVNLDDFDAGETMIYKRQAPGAAAGATRSRTGATRAGARLIGLSGKHKGSTIPIPPEGLTIGRNTACQIVLTDPRVSQRHAWIGEVDGHITLRDLKSTNGTFLNAHLNTPISEVPLRSGDTVFFGGHQGDQFLFMADPQPSAGKTPG